MIPIRTYGHVYHSKRGHDSGVMVVCQFVNKPGDMGVNQPVKKSIVLTPNNLY